MIRVKESHINNVSRLHVVPFSWLGDNDFRRLVMHWFGKEDYIETKFQMGVVLEGNHEILSLNDVLMHQNGKSFLVVWKRGSHAMLEMTIPVKLYTIEEGDGYSLTGGRLAILAQATREAR